MAGGEIAGVERGVTGEGESSRAIQSAEKGIRWVAKEGVESTRGKEREIFQAATR